MSYDYNKNLIPLTERNGAPRHEDDKLQAIVKAAIKSALQEEDRAIVNEMRELTMRMEKGFTRLTGNIEAFITSEQDVAVAHIVDGDLDDVPSLARYKDEEMLLHPFSATDIATELGIAPTDVAYLLSQPHGLDWTRRKPDLWSTSIYGRTKRRFWHSKTVALLREVILDPNHPERQDVSAGCQRVVERSAAQMRANNKNGSV